MTPSGIEPETFRFVAQYLNHCATISGLPYIYTHTHTHTHTTGKIPGDFKKRILVMLPKRHMSTMY
jgi:hypothetical protein